MIILRNKNFGAVQRIKDQYKYSLKEYRDPKGKEYVHKHIIDPMKSKTLPEDVRNRNRAWAQYKGQNPDKAEKDLLKQRQQWAKKLEFKYNNPRLGAIKDVIENKAWRK
jgi:hypothetical protein